VLVPSVLTIKHLLEHFLAHRHATIARRVPANGAKTDLSSREARTALIKEDLARIAAAYGDRRRTEIRTQKP
jgi:DNA gyrase/topoisomerase IV subunit A